MNLSALPSGPFCAAVFSTWIRPGDSDPWGVMGNGAWFLTGTFLTEAQATSLADLLNAAPGMVAQLAAEKARADKAEAERDSWQRAAEAWREIANNNEDTKETP
jgi:hypothetical protein